MKESKNGKRTGWMVAMGALILAGAVSIIGGAPSSKSKSEAKVTVTPSAAIESPSAPAQADSDVLDLQLD